LNQIRIENVYFLLLYAYDALEERGPAGVQPVGQTALVDLFAAVLLRAIDRLLRRGIGRGYVAHVDELTGIRGKVEFAATVKVNGFMRGSAVCQFDEPTFDTPHNQVLKATLSRLRRATGLARELHDTVVATARRLREVSDVRLTDRMFDAARVRGHLGHYRVALSVCRLLYDHLMVDESTGSVAFRDFGRDPAALAALFQRFLRGFASREQSAFKVKADTLPWQAAVGPAAMLGLLPQMETDVSLVAPGRRVVLEAKFYRQPLVIRRGQWRLRSGHLYQLFAYLKNLSIRHSGEAVEGVLIYPKMGRRLRLSLFLHGHKVRVWTVDLSQPWNTLRSELLRLIHSLCGPGRSGVVSPGRSETLAFRPAGVAESVRKYAPEPPPSSGEK
jgi:5-methylcytosine-specific restriction enzyme subunit McrC